MCFSLGLEKRSERLSVGQVKAGKCVDREPGGGEVHLEEGSTSVVTEGWEGLLAKVEIMLTGYCYLSHSTQPATYLLC